MTPEIALVFGLVLAALVMPMAFSDFAEGRRPRSTAILALVAGALVVFALRTAPGGIAPADLPGAFFTGIGQLLP